MSRKLARRTHTRPITIERTHNQGAEAPEIFLSDMASTGRSTSTLCWGSKIRILPRMAASPETLLLVVELLIGIDPAHKKTLLDACSLAFLNGKCVEMSTQAGAYAFSARVEGTGSEHLLVDVTLRAHGQQLYASREISFQPEDEEGERARSLGLAVGVLAHSLEEEHSARRPPPPAEDTSSQDPPEENEDPPLKATTLQAEQARKAPPPKKQDDNHSTTLLLGLEGGLQYDPTWKGVAPGGGGFVGVGLSPQLLVMGRFFAAHQRPSDERPGLTFLAPSSGLAWLFPGHKLRAMLNLEAGAEKVTTTIKDTGNADAIPKLARWAGFARAGASLHAPVGRGFYASFSPALLVSFSPTVITIDGVDEGKTGLVRFIAQGGVTWVH